MRYASLKITLADQQRRNTVATPPTTDRTMTVDWWLQFFDNHD